MRIRSKTDGAVLDAELCPPAEDTNYGNLVPMARTGQGRVAINMVEAQQDYELVAASPEEQARLEEAGYFLATPGRAGR